ncbi:putative vacuolar sorting protein 39/Transforming growth factor beta receptor-associated domain 1 [Helianthus annuus]|uniref:Putative vacuolar sorting protein 39 n=1 Tax=Helianthus annuus TaxID=4232 RepID=A0A251S3C6_HELAN|nr:vacuolar sorting protein 39 [Helianthus annuus]KAF5762333.1 putative vacuolar sorting protein 39/Transforming growth factor beta receptor-associated domain 1 [Helianthus annuus]KAJ0646715.1 putative vacuolar sorting protein 39/Transforming growth factor beta receptor-associated domain 1 [Helianthus annuus]
MVHTAYDSLELITGCSTKIDAVESYGSNLLIACADGSLRIYGPESSTSPDRSSQTLELKREPYVLQRTVNGFSKRPMLAMEVLASRELLLSVSESISFHKLPTLETLAVITKAKGANVYSWDDRRGFLCFARQKRVCIFRHEGGRGFVEVKEFGVPDTVKSMSWCGENICLGIRREYMILNASNGALSEIFPSGRIAPPLVVSLPSGELLLGKDNIGVLVDQNGKLLQEGRICWSEAPAVVVIQKPYATALLPRHIEIRSLRVPYPLIQTVVLRDVCRIHQGNNAIIVALSNSVYGLFPVPLGAQIVQLTASGNFEEALALCKLLPPEDSSLRASKEQSIHIRYAHYLFENGSYEEAMEHFVASQVEITYVLSLYPSIVIPKSSVISEPDKFLDVGGEAYLSRGNSGISDDMEQQSSSNILEYDENSALESKKMSHNTLMALVKFLQKKRSYIIGKAAAEGTDEVVSDAVGHTFVSYESSRPKRSTKGRVNIPLDSRAREMAAILDTALLQALLLTGQTTAALELLKGLNYCDVKICDEILRNGNHYLCLLELYKSNSLHREALKLLHQLVEESKSDEPKIELTRKFKPEMIIEYLKPLCGIDPMIVLEFSMLVLESCPTQTIELFLSGNIPADLVNSYLKQHAPNMQATYLELMLSMNEAPISGNLQNEMVQIYLSEVLDWYADLVAEKKWDEKTYTPTRKKLLSALEGILGYTPEVLLKRLPTTALFEERALLLGKMNQHELALSIYVHKLHVPELALSYCDRVYESGLNQQPAKASGNIYLTLLQIYLNPRRTTKNIEKRISNLVSTPTPKVGWSSAKGNKGKGFGKKIADIEGAAEDIRISPSGTDSGKSDGDGDDDVGDDEGVSNIMLDEVLDVLIQRWDRVNGAQALKLLPKETKLQNLVPFLGPLLRKTSEAHRNFSVIKSLRESENLQAKDELYRQRKAVVKITADNMCSLCNKKIGTSVFAVYPNGNTIVHFVCFRDSQNMKATGKGRRQSIR